MANCVLYCVNLIKMPFEWLVGLRYTRAGRRNGRNSFISFISAISMAGIALGVTALIVVLSVYNRAHGVRAGARGTLRRG
jgi:lipoprotein-releasing system permease protein